MAASFSGASLAVLGKLRDIKVSEELQSEIADLDAHISDMTCRLSSASDVV